MELLEGWYKVLSSLICQLLEKKKSPIGEDLREGVLCMFNGYIVGVYSCRNNVKDTMLSLPEDNA